MSTTRRIRGVFGTGLTWAAAWGAVGAVIHVLATLLGWSGFVSPSFLNEVFMHLSMGFLGGAAFSGGLVITEGRRTLDEIRPGGGALWGAVAGVLGPLVFFLVGGGAGMLDLVHTWPFFVGSGLLGAGSGTAMVQIARAAARELTSEPAAPALPEGG